MLHELISDFIVESDAIEEISNDWHFVLSQVKQRYSRGHVGAILTLDEMTSTPLNNYIDKSLICNVQKMIVEDQWLAGERRLPDNQIGAYRNIRIWVGDQECLPPEEVEKAMKQLLDKSLWIQQNSRFMGAEDKLGHIAHFHYSFEKIHPFADGNGRAGRALVYFLMRFACLTPFVFTSFDRFKNYYPCFRHKNDALMKNYFRDKFYRQNGSLTV